MQVWLIGMPTSRKELERKFNYKRLDQMRAYLEKNLVPNDPKESYEVGKMMGELLNVMTMKELQILLGIQENPNRKPLE